MLNLTHHLINRLRQRHRSRPQLWTEASLGKQLRVEGFDTGFTHGEAAYNGLGVAADKEIYFSASTKSLHHAARIFGFDPQTHEVRTIADLRSLTSERTIPQGKIHVDLVTLDGCTYGATHLGYYDPHSRFERPLVPAGYAPYPGGCFFSLEQSQVQPIAHAREGEGIITLAADPRRGMLYALTWPSGELLRLQVETRTLRNYGAVLGAGETGSRWRSTWVRICRSLAVHPDTGSVHWCDDKGRIFRSQNERIEAVAQMPRAEGWRKLIWHPEDKVFYGITWGSGALFRFDPAHLKVTEMANLHRDLSLHQAATLALTLDSNLRVLHYLAPGHGIQRTPQRLASTVSYVTYDLSTGDWTSHGTLRLSDGRWVTQAQSLLQVDDFLYATAWIELPHSDTSARAHEIRLLHRDSPAFRTRGYAEEISLIRLPRSGA